MPKFVYDFTEGNKDLKDLLGGKGANLAEMTNLGLPVPPGFTITTDACRYYLEHGTTPDGLDGEVDGHLSDLENAMGRKLGDPADPLLVSVRSGAKFSMPGMMETVLNIGLSDESVHGLAKQAGNERFAWDSYRRLIQMFGKTVLGIDGEHFEHAIDSAKKAKGATNDTQLDAEDLKNLTQTYKELVREHAKRDFPQDPREQMDLAVKAVFESWNAERAILYRRQERIPADLGTAGVPGVKDGPDRQVHLLARVLREVAARLLAHDLLVGVREVPEVLGVQVGVRRGAAGLLRGLERAVEMLAVDPQDRLAEHLDQPPVGVPREPLVIGLLGQAAHRLVR